MQWMMKILDTKNIQLDEGDEFDEKLHEANIEAVAHKIVALKGLLSVVLVRKISFENYSIVSGHLEYFAYLKALEFDNTLPDRIGVFIVEPEMISLAKDQISTLEPIFSPGPEGDSRESFPMNQLLKPLNRIEQKIITTGQIDRLQSTVITAIDDRVPKILPMFGALDGILSQQNHVSIHNKVKEFLEKNKGDKKTKKVMEVLRSSREQGRQIRKFSDLKEILDSNKEQQKNGRMISLMSLSLWMEISDSFSPNTSKSYVSKKDEILSSSPIDNNDEDDDSCGSLEFNNFLQRLKQLERNIATVDQVQQAQSTMIKALDEKIPTSLPMFEALEGILDDRTAVQVQQNLSRHLTKSKVERVMNVLRSSRELGLSISTFSDLKTILDNNKDRQKNRSVSLMSPARCMTISDDWQ